MRHLSLLPLIICLLLGLAGCTGSSGNSSTDTPTADDSICFNRIRQLMREDNLSAATVELESFLENTDAKTSHMYMYALVDLGWCRLCGNRQKEALQLVYQGDSIAHAIGDEEMMAYFRYYSGRYMIDEDNERGRQYIQESIDMMKALFNKEKESGKRYLLARYIHNYYDNLISFMEESLIDQQIAKLDEMEQFLELCEREKVFPDDQVEERRSEIVFQKINVYTQQGDFDEARKMYHLYEPYIDTTSLYGKSQYASMRMALGDFQEVRALEEYLYNEYLNRDDSLDLNQNYCSQLYTMSKLYEGLGDKKRAEQFEKEHKRVSDCITLHHANQKMAQMSSQYGVQQQQYVIEEQKLKNRISKTINHALFTILLISLGIVSLLFYINRVTRKKNAALAQLINQMLDEKERNRKQAQIRAQMTARSGDGTHEPVSDSSDTGESDSDEPVERFINALISRQLYCDEKFDRDVLLEELHIQRRNFAQQFEAYTGSQISQYVLVLRLEHAADLIRRRPNYTIDSIALDSGFGSRATFYRNFTRQYGITPSEYRNQMLNPAS